MQCDTKLCGYAGGNCGNRTATKQSNHTAAIIAHHTPSRALIRPLPVWLASLPLLESLPVTPPQSTHC